MNTTSDSSLPPGTTPQFANMHRWLQRGLFVCLVALVIEASLTLPGELVWFGWPTLSASEICDELMKVRWSDDNARCLIPHPLYGANEGEGRTTAKDRWGIQPKPEYKRIGFRDLVKFRNERLAREAAEKAAREAAGAAPAPTPPQ